MLRTVSRVVLLLIAVLCLLGPAAEETAAEELFCSEEKPKGPPQFEAYTGGNVTNSGYSLYSNTVWAFGNPVAGEGWRLRIGGEHSDYETEMTAGYDNTPVVKRESKSAGNIAIGYQANFGILWLKTYAGAVYRQHTKTLDDIVLLSSELEAGALLAVESWWRLDERAWASFDVSWTSLDNGASVYSRAAYDITLQDRLWPAFAAGVEAGAYSDDINPAGHKVGMFTQARWERHEVTLSGGYMYSGDEEEAQPYAGLSYGRKF